MIHMLLPLSPERILVVSTEWVYSYTVYLFINSFFSSSAEKSRIYGTCIYVLQLALNIFVFLFVSIPFVYFSVNVGMVFLITLNYESPWLRRVFISVSVYAVGALIELLLFGFTLKTDFFSAVSGRTPFTSIILTRLIYLFVAVIVGRLCNLRRGEKVPGVYWLIISVLFLFNLVIAFFISNSNMEILPFFATVSIYFVENVLLFFFLDRMVSLQEKSEQVLVSDLQNESYRRQLSIMNESLETTKIMRHDMKNQMFMVQGLLESGDYTAALDHVRTMTGTWAAVSKSVNTGNIEVDSLINFKLSQAEQERISVKHHIRIPEQFGLRSFDMAAVIGNLFDNAFDALKKLPENARTLAVEIRYSKGRLFVIFENPYTGTVVWKNGIPATQKRICGIHGVGLSDVFTTAEKYDGQVDISTTGSLFKVTVMLYVG
ncbi:MAG: GHKL domain-containing protein [Treponema sp.]|nr:GHKL domain-containing protein [Treponema sp.]